MQKLAAPTASMAEPLANFEGFEEAFEGQFRATRKKKKGFGAREPRAYNLRNSAHNLAQSPEPTIWQVRGFGASEASRMQKLAAPTVSMAEPLASFEGFEAFEGHFRATRKKGFGAREPRALSLRNSAHSLAQSPEPTGKRKVLERLKRAECRCWLLQRLVWQNHWQVSRDLRHLKGNFGPLEEKKKDLAPQSPEPTVYTTPPIVSHRAHSLASARFWSV